MNLSSELRIETPEGIRFSYPLAGPVTRGLAWLVDLVLILWLTYLLGRVLSALSTVAPDLAGAGASLVLAWFAINLVWTVSWEWWWRGQTPGKRLFHLRVMDVHGFRLRFYQVLLRNLLRAVDSLPLAYGVGGAVCFFSPHAQRLGDLAAGTVVIYHRPAAEPDVAQLGAGKYNSLRSVPHLAARLRQRVSPGEASLALQALLRREELEATARVALFHELAEHFRALAPYPPELTELLSDEQYVRDVADVLFRTEERQRRKAAEV